MSQVKESVKEKSDFVSFYEETADEFKLNKAGSIPTNKCTGILHVSMEENNIMCDKCKLLNPQIVEKAHTVPFAPLWAFGLDFKNVLNLTVNKSEYRVFYTASHIGVIYCHKTKQMQFLMGHREAITSISVDITGKWLATADANEDNTVIVWDSADCFPVHTIFNAHENYGVKIIKLTPDAKFLITVGFEPNAIIKFWLWTLGDDEPNGVYTAKKQFGEVQAISVNPNNCTHFAVTFSELMVFFTWEDSCLHDTVAEITLKKSKYGQLVDTTYMEMSHECLTVTTNGWVVIWGNSFHNVAYESMPVNNNKIFIKAIRLQKTHICSIQFVDGVICTTDNNGKIKFYDKQLKILYFCLSSLLPPVNFVSFNLTGRKYKFQDPTVLDTERTEDSILGKNNEPTEEDRSDEYEQIFAKLLPSDFTLQRSPFLVRDYMILTMQGQLAYVDATENKLDFIFATHNVSITAIDVHSEKPILCLGYANGVLITNNYKECTVIMERTIMNSKEKAYNKISCIRYSPQGIFLACGTSGGHLWFLEPTTLKPYNKKPFIYDHSIILDIKFSENNMYLAYYDSSMAVCLMKRSDNDTKNTEWIFYGRHITHSKPITGLLFKEVTRLFSIAMDKYLVEYNVEESEPGKLVVASRIRVMQRGYPVCFINYEISPDRSSNFFLIATNEYKFLIINEQTDTLERTILAPVLNEPVQSLSIICKEAKNYVLYRTGKYFGIQLLPISGNPFRRANLVAHPKRVANFSISSCGKYAFTLGEDDNICITWMIRFEAVEYIIQSEGTALAPYYTLLEGGAGGWFFQEMKDLFYYMQILHQGEDSPFPRSVTDKISIAELPNLMRAVGYYPTEYELENILYEVKYYFITNNDEEEEEISFENFVKLYLNHRPVNGFTKQEIKWAFDVLGDDDGEGIAKSRFIDLMCHKGEPFEYAALYHCMTILLCQNKTNQNEDIDSWNDQIPEVLTFDCFMNDVLGIDESKENSS